ncbi:hypothetical protein EV380_2562 [Zhihengliuella halotolerans]|uniref:Lipase (Class 3) n=2 Tax=Zhihengliuella halotolerans TaxID=370736 RepID=A0A4V2GA56_9MICC|nr:hypothetical protein EV380_2562 [Zhihengliuella halotolerans]
MGMSGFISSGGAGQASIDCRSDDLEAAARRLEEVSGIFAEAASALRVAEGAQGSFPPRERGFFADAATVEAARALAEEMDRESATLAFRVRNARLTYEACEAEVLRSAEQLRGRTRSILLNYALESPGWYPSTRLVEDLINQSPALAGELLVGFLLGGSGVGRAAGRTVFGGWRDRERGGLVEQSVFERAAPVLAELVRTAGVGRLGPIAVEEVAEVPGARPVTGTLEGILEFQAGFARDDVPEANILISSTETAAGTVHVVAFPGTQIGGVDDGRNFADAGGAVEAAGAESEYVIEATLEALERVGVDEGDRLVFSGHSQGGMHAANAAASKQVRGLYRVEYVVTAGSPVGETAIPQDVPSLHLEHVHDPVPGLDGRPNEASESRVTVYGAGYAPGVDPTEPGGVFGPAHALENYRYLAAGATAADDPAVREAEAGLTALLAPTGATTLHRARLRRRGSTLRPAETVNQFVDRLEKNRGDAHRPRHLAPASRGAYRGRAS